MRRSSWASPAVAACAAFGVSAIPAHAAGLSPAAPSAEFILFGLTLLGVALLRPAQGKACGAGGDRAALKARFAFRRAAF